MTLQTTHSTWTDEDLVRDCLAGSEEAWAALVSRYTKFVYSVPVRYGLPPDEAADVFQSVWTDLYRDLARLQNIGALRSWLSTTAGRRSLLSRKQRKKASASLDDGNEIAVATADPVSAREEAERLALLREAIDRLPCRCQRLVRMLFFEQPARPYVEIARELGLAEGSIGFIRGRCLAKLRALLEAETPCNGR